VREREREERERREREKREREHAERKTLLALGWVPFSPC